MSAKKNKVCWVWRDEDPFFRGEVNVSPNEPAPDWEGDWYGDGTITVCVHWFRRVTGLPLPKLGADPIRVRFSAEVLP